ncbi:sensor histidine kinase [Terricaulis sp.]|uniref:sensor histidine kinase n=1 Tax=Terricaulis sp. TaxID=2768686 RepID=UPI002AC5443E|nr:sensor histidine kinase [Terricaulis sp.]MDZ4690586.1 sensor histidine kinase [Terricaulis sp.]
MNRNCVEMDDRRPDGATDLKALQAENARLRRLCTEAGDLALRQELLLREGDHRIKNSLQIVASLMGMQERRETNAAARVALHAATARIQAVARIHDALQLGGSADPVNLGTLIEAMCVALHEMAGDPLRVTITVNAESIDTPIALAQPLVLAVNELVLNALRHAFPDERAGAIAVSLRREAGGLRVVVADNGVGLPAGQARSAGFGMKLVQMMAAKVGGELRIESTNGARFALTVPYAASA